MKKRVSRVLSSVNLENRQTKTGFQADFCGKAVKFSRKAVKFSVFWKFFRFLKKRFDFFGTVPYKG